MGNNHSKPCSGDPERELRRAQQEALQKLYTPSPDMAQKTVHIHCHPDEVDQILQEIHAAPIMLHFKVEKSLEITPENPLEGGEKPGAVENSAAAVSVAVEAAQPGEGVMAKPEPPGDAVVRSKLVGDIVVGSHAQPPEMDGTLAYLCDQVFSSTLHVIEKSSRDFLGRRKGHSAVQGPSPSSLESQPSKLSCGSQASYGSIGAAELLNSGDGQPPNEGSFLANDQKAPCLELAPGDVSGAVEEPTTTGHVQLEEASFEESLEEVDGAPHDASTTEMADECSDVKVAPRSQDVAEPLLNLDRDLLEAVAKSLLVLNGGEDALPEDRCDGEKVDVQPEVLLQRAQRETLATAEPEGETEQPTASETFPRSKSHGRSIHALCKKTDADLFLTSDSGDLRSLQEDRAVPTSEENEHPASVVQNAEVQPPAGFAEITRGAASSPKTAEAEQGGPPFSSAESTEPVNRREDGQGTRLSPLSFSVSEPALEDGSPGQNC